MTGQPGQESLPFCTVAPPLPQLMMKSANTATPMIPNAYFIWSHGSKKTD
jgi:hypothetical protein